MRVTLNTLPPSYYCNIADGSEMGTLCDSREGRCTNYSIVHVCVYQLIHHVTFGTARNTLPELHELLLFLSSSSSSLLLLLKQ